MINKSSNSSRSARRDVGILRWHIANLVSKHHPMTIRQLYYQMVSLGVIPKTEVEYRQVVIRLCGEMREDGALPWDWTVDSSRRVLIPLRYKSVEDAVEYLSLTYRRDLWNDQNNYAEVWCEKETLTEILWEITRDYGVCLRPVKGFASKSFAHEAAETIKALGKPTYLYYIGDYDPSGLTGWQDIQTRLDRYINPWRREPKRDLYFTRLAVTEEQIKQYELPMRPTKLVGNRHATKWKANTDSVEVDALPPAILQTLVKQAITSHINWKQWKKSLEAEKRDRGRLERLRRMAPQNA